MTGASPGGVVAAQAWKSRIRVPRQPLSTALSLMETDYYSLLGVNRNASEPDIQKAYRSLAKQYHPDLNPDDDEAKGKFQQIQRAYDVLGDAEQKRLYDLHGSGYESIAGGAGPGQGSPWEYRQGPGGAAGYENIDLNSLFGSMGGGGPQTGGGFSDFFKGFTRSGANQTHPQRGKDLVHELQIPWTTSIQGGDVALRVRRSGGNTETITVKIPPGVEEDQKIRLRGQGEPALRGGSAGDIIITVRVASHPSYTRKGKDLILRLPVTIGEAAAGATIDVPTPKGTVALKIPPVTSSGQRLRIKGHGVPGKDSPGDLFAEIQIILPKKLSDEDREALKQIDAQNSFDPRADLKW